MRPFVIGLFIITLLAGIMAKMLSNHQSSSDQTGLVGNILNAIGVRKHAKEQTAQADEIARQFGEKKNSFSEYLQDQQRNLRSSREEMGSLTQIIKEVSNKESSVDILRLKELMKQCEDRTALLIEHGKEIEKFNEERMKANAKLALEADKNFFISNSDRNRLLAQIKDGLDQQNDRMSQQLQDNQALRNKIQQIHDQVQQMHDQELLKQNTQLAERLQTVSDKTQTVLDAVGHQEQKLQDVSQKNQIVLDSMKEKTDRLKQKNQDFMDRNRQNILDKTQAANDRIQDQLEKLQEHRPQRY